MICPKCHNTDTRVYDTRVTQNGRATRRRRECENCGYRYTTLEEIKLLDLYVEKKNGRVELLSEDKLASGIKKAFNKRYINNDKVAILVQKVVEDIIEINRNPIKSTKIGRIVLKNLRKSDEAAYICYWAMFGNFESAVEFNKLLKEFNR
ncbi:MAG: ATP cone domain-containing protein [Patescibacteria group bacterium]